MPKQAAAYLGFPAKIRSLLSPERLSWKSRLSLEPIAFNLNPEERVVRIVNDSALSRSSISRSLGKLFPKDPSTGSSHWKDYLESYALLTAFSDTYRDELERIDALLPYGKTRLLLGGLGTRNLSSFLSLRSAPRSFFGLGELGTTSFDGGFLSHVFSHSPSTAALMQRLFDDLNPRAKLVIVEPTKKTRAREKMKGFLIQLAQSAVRNHSPMNDFDLALVSYVTLHRLTRRAGKFCRMENLEAVAMKVGFSIERSEAAHGGFERMLVLSK